MNENLSMIRQILVLYVMSTTRGRRPCPLYPPDRLHKDIAKVLEKKASQDRSKNASTSTTTPKPPIHGTQDCICSSRTPSTSPASNPFFTITFQEESLLCPIFPNLSRSRDSIVFNMICFLSLCYVFSFPTVHRTAL